MLRRVGMAVVDAMHEEERGMEMGMVAMMRHGLLLGCWLALVVAAKAGAGEDRYTAFLAMTPEKQTAYAKNKVKKTGLYFSCKLGRYVINSEVSPADSCRWALMLDNYTDEILSERIVPKKKLNPGDPQVFVAKTREGYQRALDDFTGGRADAGWSGGMFTWMIRGGTAKAGLFAFYEQFAGKGDAADSEREEKKSPVKTGSGELSAKEYAGMTEVLLHEGTHQMLFYHLGTAVPLWFNEGMATNFETYDCDLSFKANLYNAMYVNNRADAAVLFLQDKKLKPFPAIFSITSRAWQAAQGEEVYVNYATAWAACNYIFTSRDGRDFVDIFMSAIVKENMKTADETKLSSVFSASRLEKLDAGLREHVLKVLLPACKYGRALRRLLNEGEKEKAEAGIAKMKEEFPESLEMKFYQLWLDVLNDKDVPAALKALPELRKNTDFNHPEYNYVLALATYKSGTKSQAKNAIDDALKSNSAHAPTLALKEQIAQMK